MPPMKYVAMQRSAGLSICLQRPTCRLLGRHFLYTSIEGYEAVCRQGGEVFVMTLSKPHSANRKHDLLRLGSEKVDTPEFQLFPVVSIVCSPIGKP